MRPNTSVRQPVIAGARRQQLSDLLRVWRNQPRKRSPVLFWGLLTLTFAFDTALVYLGIQRLGLAEPAPATQSEDLFAVALADFLNVSRQTPQIDEYPSAARRLAQESWLNKYRPVRQALYFSRLAVGLLTVSTLAGKRRPLWRRGFLLSGLLACAGSLMWLAAGTVCRAMLHDEPPVGDASAGIVWASSAVMSLALLLALLGRDGFIALAGALISSAGFVLANHWPPAFVANWTTLPNGDGWLHLQVLTLISAYAALTLAWGVAALGLAQMALVPPSAERLRRLASLCLWPIGIAVMLLVVSAVLDGFRAMELSDTWHGWNAQALGTFLALPVCSALLYGRWMGWIQPFGAMMLTVLGFAAIAMSWQAISDFGTGDRHVATLLAGTDAVYAAGFLSFSLAAHAALRYFFGKQQIAV